MTKTASRSRAIPRQTVKRAQSPKGSPERGDPGLVWLVRRRASNYVRLPGITSVGIAYELTDGVPTGRIAVRYTVARKKSKRELRACGLDSLPENFETEDGRRIPVDVVRRSYRPTHLVVPTSAATTAATLHLQRRQRCDPLVPGVSIGHPESPAGTIGCVVFDSDTGAALLLSNWHVLHGPGVEVGQHISQPGPHDDSNLAANAIGELVRSHIGLAGDCAVCSIRNRQLIREIVELGAVPARVAKVELGDAVVKSGRTTGVTYGIVSAIETRTIVPYEDRQRWIGGFEIAPNPAKPAADGEISDVGDSGSLWLIDHPGAESDVAVGLQVSGEDDPNPSREHAFACYLHSALTKLRVTLTPPSS